jgi:G3E family GTPase
MTLIPVTILTGFLGSGKSTLLKRLLTEAHGRKIAVIENEFAEESIDGEILASTGSEQIVQMSNGCVCCSIRDDLRATLCNLAQRRRQGELDFERVMIETTGLADPGPVAQTFFLDADVVRSYRPDAILTMVDAKHAMGQLDSRAEARRQVAFADRLLISKADLVSSDQMQLLSSRLRGMNRAAPQSIVQSGDVGLLDLFDLRAFNVDHHLEQQLDAATGDCSAPDRTSACAHPNHSHEPDHPHHHAHDDVTSFVFRSERPFRPDKFGQFMDAMVKSHGSRLFRYKGVLNMQGSDRKVIFQGVHQLMSSDFGLDWADEEDRISRLVFIGLNLPKEMFMRSLGYCLA